MLRGTIIQKKKWCNATSLRLLQIHGAHTSLGLFRHQMNSCGSVEASFSYLLEGPDLIHIPRHKNKKYNGGHVLSPL